MHPNSSALVANKQAYFPHIDGLRALAVISVILFHLEFAFFSGGFIGVDIFFVISGYLITAHIRQSVNDDRFSFAKFYAKRARRLLPALFATLILTLLAGWFVLPAANYERLSIETLFAVFSASNFLFWNESGYFDSASTLKPLLHTWSLSVEEQFYLFWPLLLCFIKRERSVFSLLAIMGIVSLIAAQLLVKTKPDLVFYMMPLRVVEFSIGGVLVWLTPRIHLKQHAQEIMCLLGLAAIVIPVIVYNDSTIFPGITAVIPCVGTALIILFGVNSRTTCWLSFRPVVFVGLISYSLYLVHWPLIVLFKYDQNRLLLSDKLLLLLVALLLAALMYFFIETPFRKRRGFIALGPKAFAFSMVLTATLLTGFAWKTKVISGWPARSGVEQLSAEQIEKGKNARFQLLHLNCGNRGWDVCEVPSADIANNVLVIGDSHAADALNILQLAYPDKYYVLKDTGGCPPTVVNILKDLWPNWPDLEKCQQLNEERFDPDYLNQFDTVVIGVYWGTYTPELLLQTYEYLQQNSHTKLVVFGNYLALNKPMSDFYNQQIDPRTTPALVKDFAVFDEPLQELSEDRYRYVSKRALFCDGDGLESCQLQFGRFPYSYDEHHLSFQASEYAAKRLKKQYPEWHDFTSLTAQSPGDKLNSN